MIEVSKSQVFTEQELRVIFGRYLPVQPMPAHCTNKLTARVLAEVATTLHQPPLVRLWHCRKRFRTNVQGWFGRRRK